MMLEAGLVKKTSELAAAARVTSAPRRQARPGRIAATVTAIEENRDNEGHTGICPHCGGASEYQNVRYPRALCHACDLRVTDLKGRPVGLTNESMSGGFVAYHRDDESPCEQVISDGHVLVDDTEYRA